MEARAPTGMYFEDFEIGKVYKTPRRTITNTDIVNFANLSGDFNAPHVDWEFCKQQPYEEPIAHGPLILAIAGGLGCQSGINDGTIIAMLGLDEWRIHKPVKHGDTIEVATTPTEKRLSSKGDQGIVTTKREVLNQNGDVVHSMKLTSMYRCRPKL
jgi:acyl dehydratase